MNKQYSLINHSILPLVYRIFHPSFKSCQLSYLLKDPQSQSLILFNPKKVNHNYQWMLEHIKAIQEQTSCNLSTVVTNTPQNNFQESPLKKLNPSLKYFMPGSDNALKPEIIGELSICFIGAQGYHPSYNLIGVTHMTPTSTKLPCLFVNKMLGVSTIDYRAEISESSYLKTLDIAKYFPNETFIFPDQLVDREDLLFSKALFSAISPQDSSTVFVSQKLEQYEKNSSNKPDCLIPTSILEQKTMNPFLNPLKFQKLFRQQGDKAIKDRIKCFSLLRSMRREWKSQ